MGSDGLIGRHIHNHLHKKMQVDPFDLSQGYNLTREEVVKKIFTDTSYDAIINCFAWNDHVKPGEKRGNILDQAYDDFKACMDVNVSAMFMVCKEYAKSRLGQGGNIINFGASTGIVTARTDMYGGSHKNCGYSTSKAAVIHMTRILATHLIHLDPEMRVNCISPGGVKSDQPEEFHEIYGSHAPIGRMCNLEDLMPPIELLLNERNRYMVGANIIVDGGWTLQ